MFIKIATSNRPLNDILKHDIQRMLLVCTKLVRAVGITHISSIPVVPL